MRVWTLAVVAFLLGGCATAPSPAPVANPALAWRARVAKLAPLGTWDVRGRLALRTAHHGGEVSLRWVRDDSRYTIHLSGPLGHGLVQLQQGPGGARLEDAHRHVYRAANAEVLLFETTGWHVPLDGLTYWIRGLPVPGIPHEQNLDGAGQLQYLQQLGWTIRFLAYARYGRYILPRDIELMRPAPANATRTTGAHPPGERLGPVEARLVIERWAYLR